MKKIMSKNKPAIIGLAAFLTAAVVNPVKATETDPPTVEIRYLGFQQHNPVFEIALSSVKTDYYFITIKDESGQILFAEKIKGYNVSRKYRIDTDEEIKEGGLVFEVRSVNTKKTAVYTVGVTETVKRDIAVNKIQ